MCIRDSIGALDLDIKLGEGVETKLVAVFLAEIPLNLRFSGWLVQLPRGWFLFLHFVRRS